MSLKIQEATQFSQNWERFFILWMNTPEIFVGSCILSVVAVIAVYFITRGDSCLSPSGERHGDYPKRKARINSKRRHFLNHPSEDSDDINLAQETEDQEVEGFETGGLEFPFKELTTYKKSLYRVAAEKLEKSLTEEQLSEEREVQQQQLKAIYDLMKSKEEVFGIRDLSQMEEQLKFYG